MISESNADRPEWVFVDVLTLSSPRIQDILQKVGGFHDALLLSADYCDGSLELSIESPYFIEHKKYDCFGISGARIRLSLQDEPTTEMRARLKSLVDFDVYRLDLAETKFGCVFYFTNAGQTDLFEHTFEVDLNRSTLQWIFQK